MRVPDGDINTTFICKTLHIVGRYDSNYSSILLILYSYRLDLFVHIYSGNMQLLCVGRSDIP